MRVPFNDLSAQYRSIKDEIDQAMQAVIEETAFAGGPFVESFERNFARTHGAQHCVAVASGTAALHVALWATGFGPGDEVIVPTNTFFATPEAVSLTGATPVFVDCEPGTYGLAPDEIERVLSPRTRGIIAVHLYGQAAALEQIAEIADARGLVLLEDCAQAHLATSGGRPVGTRGICGCFSFYPGKNLGAYGEAGAVITNDGEVAERIRELRDHGSPRKHWHHRVGQNYRMDGLQGAVLDTKLRHLAHWTDQRRGHADHYRRALSGLERVGLPSERNDTRHVYHLFVVRVPQRGQLLAFLAGRGIGVGVHYPIPCHRQAAYADLPTRALPCAESLADEIISLPMYAELAPEQIDHVAAMLGEFFHA